MKPILNCTFDLLSGSFTTQNLIFNSVKQENATIIYLSKCILYDMIINTVI